MRRAASGEAAQVRKDVQVLKVWWEKLMWRVQKKDGVEVGALLLDIVQLTWVD